MNCPPSRGFCLSRMMLNSQHGTSLTHQSVRHANGSPSMTGTSHRALQSQTHPKDSRKRTTTLSSVTVTSSNTTTAGVQLGLVPARDGYTRLQVVGHHGAYRPTIKLQRPHMRAQP